jgi:predicted lipoprotein with Yx(FWY)xxD motif
MKQLCQNSLKTLLLALLVFTFSCGDDNDTPDAPEVTKEIKLQTSPTLGNYLVDKDGRTLYFFSNDFNGQNNCPGGCEAVWPYFNLENLTAEQLGDGLAFTDFATITAANGKKQLTYKTWPLYYYAPLVNGVNTQEAAGLTTGEGVGGIWFVAKPDYSVMLVNAQLVGHNGKNYKSDYSEGTGKTIYFSDGLGKTLYGFKQDKSNKNNFTNQDATHDAVWPIYETDKIVVPSTLDKTLFGSITVFGKKQLTYKGWPLYYFQQDAGVRGANKGISFPAPGVWPVLTKDIAAAPQ